MIWQKAASQLIGHPCEVRTVSMPYKMGGMAGWENGHRIIELAAASNDAERLHNFLHECAHHRLKHVPRNAVRGSDAELKQSAAKISFQAKANAKYRALKRERQAEAMANLWLEEINNSSWPHAALPEQKLAAWLRG